MSSPQAPETPTLHSPVPDLPDPSTTLTFPCIHCSNTLSGLPPTFLQYITPHTLLLCQSCQSAHHGSNIGETDVIIAIEGNLLVLRNSVGEHRVETWNGDTARMAAVGMHIRATILPLNLANTDGNENAPTLAYELVNVRGAEGTRERGVEFRGIPRNMLIVRYRQRLEKEEGMNIRICRMCKGRIVALSPEKTLAMGMGRYLCAYCVIWGR